MLKNEWRPLHWHTGKNTSCSAVQLQFTSQLFSSQGQTLDLTIAPRFRLSQWLLFLISMHEYLNMFLHFNYPPMCKSSDIMNILLWVIVCTKTVFLRKHIESILMWAKACVGKTNAEVWGHLFIYLLFTFLHLIEFFCCSPGPWI